MNLAPLPGRYGPVSAVSLDKKTQKLGVQGSASVIAGKPGSANREPLTGTSSRFFVIVTSLGVSSIHYPIRSVESRGDQAANGF